MEGAGDECCSERRVEATLDMYAQQCARRRGGIAREGEGGKVIRWANDCQTPVALYVTKIKYWPGCQTVCEFLARPTLCADSTWSDGLNQDDNQQAGFLLVWLAKTATTSERYPV